MPPRDASVIAIPADGKHFACKVIWLSQRTKDVMALVVLPGAFSSIEDITLTNGPYQTFVVMGRPTQVIYADAKNVTKRKIWPVIGTLPITSEDEALLLHQVGASLYQGDEYLRNVSPDEQGKYPKMLVAGNAAVEGFLKQLP